VKLTGTLLGLDQWPAAYRVSIAGFTDDGDEYATIEKSIGADNAGDGRVSIVLSGIKDDVRLVRLCVLDRLRRHVMTFQEMELQQTRDTMYLEVGTRDVSMMGAIQEGYLSTTCANCHGASNRAAAGLYLTAGRSYDALVGKPSTKVSGINLVEPGDAERSLLHVILHQEVVDGISMTHRDLVSEKNEQSILPLIDSWINNGAPAK
jgi:hypothetical protein